MAVHGAHQNPTIRAAQYVRMSTDMQKYSTENQIAAIATYAARHGIAIVKTYVDPGKSGLTIKYRHGLQQLIKDVRAPSNIFQMVLVYDVSRWGRFQDADESAYYEFLCREAGISIRYCAEEFENDGSLSSTVLKAMKRAMAAEFSRELSTRVFTGKCRMTMRGFHAGGRSGYGLRRMLVDEDGRPKSELQEGERKFLHTDRTILVPGPPDEVEVVRWIFDEFVTREKTIASIVRSLNARGIFNALGRRWQKTSVRAVLCNEKYIGNSVFNRSSIRLKSRRVKMPQEQWIRAPGAYEPIVEKDVFIAAQARLSANSQHFTRFELLDSLTAHWCKHGKLSCRLINNSPTCPRHTSFRRLFGSLLEAFEAVGYRHGSRRPIYASIEKAIADSIIAEVGASGGDARRQGRRRRQNYVLVHGELHVSIHLAYARYRNRAGKPRFMLRAGAPIRSDISVLVPFDRKGHRIVDYYILPGFLLTNPQPYLFDKNAIELEAFRSATLKPLIDILTREDIARDGYLNRSSSMSQSRLPPLRPLHFSSRGRRRGSARLLRSLERLSHLVASFTVRCKRHNDGQLRLHRDLGCLLNDMAFQKILAREGLHTVPRLVHDRLSFGWSDLASQAASPAQPWLPPFRECGCDLTPERSRRVQEMRLAFANSSLAFSNLLVAASRPDEFVGASPGVDFLSPEDRAYVQRHFRPIEDAAHHMLSGFAERAFGYALTRAYIRTLLGNERVANYVREAHRKTYQRLVAARLMPGPLR